ncbi:MAG: DUF1003 domain-containing protein [Janthinobacterium lividum]
MNLVHGIHETEKALLDELRSLRRVVRDRHVRNPSVNDLTLGQRVADRVAAVMGSWTFIIVQSLILAVWVALNVTAWIRVWDPYPFILLNLALSFQAAYAAPIIMMSQNRQSDIDRKAAEIDAKINVKAELEIELLHHKLDELRQREVQELVTIVRELAQLLNRSGQGDAPEMRQACEVLAGGSDADARSTRDAAAPSSQAASLPEGSL